MTESQNKSKYKPINKASQNTLISFKPLLSAYHELLINFKTYEKLHFKKLRTNTNWICNRNYDNLLLQFNIGCCSKNSTNSKQKLKYENNNTTRQGFYI